MLTLQPSKSRSVCLLMFKINQDSLGDVILLTSQGVSFTDLAQLMQLSLVGHVAGYFIYKFVATNMFNCYDTIA